MGLRDRRLRRGGGTLAARLVEAGARVFLLEAGGDARGSDAARMPDDYDVPAFHAYACENPEMSWNFQVRHYASEARQARDRKYTPGAGVLYPRAATLGGCTAHNAMIYMPPHDSDWNHVAELTGDTSWRAARCAATRRRVEDCGHAPLWRALRRLGIDPTGHGWDGWLRTEKSIPLAALGDEELVRMVRAHDPHLRRRPGDAAGERAALAAPRRRPERAAAAAAAASRACATRRSRPAATAAPARASACSKSRQRTATGCTSSSMRSRPASSSMPAEPRAAVAYRKGRRLYRAHAEGRAQTPGEARGARAARGDPVRRRVQHAAAADALGIGPAAHLQRARHRRCGSISPASARTCRTATKSR